MLRKARNKEEPMHSAGKARLIVGLRKGLFALLASALVASCATVGSQYVNGGRMVDGSYQIGETLISYVSDNEDLAATYHLIHDEGKLAILEENESSYSVIINHNRKSEKGDHFVIWIKGAIFGASGPAGEIIVPTDRRQPAEYHWYPAGTYLVEKIDGTKRPVSFCKAPLCKQEPTALLVPRQEPK